MAGTPGSNNILEELGGLGCSSRGPHDEPHGALFAKQLRGVFADGDPTQCDVCVCGELKGVWMR